MNTFYKVNPLYFKIILLFLLLGLSYCKNKSKIPVLNYEFNNNWQIIYFSSANHEVYSEFYFDEKQEFLFDDLNSNNIFPEDSSLHFDFYEKMCNTQNIIDQINVLGKYLQDRFNCCKFSSIKPIGPFDYSADNNAKNFEKFQYDSLTRMYEYFKNN